MLQHAEHLDWPWACVFSAQLVNRPAFAASPSPPTWGRKCSDSFLPPGPIALLPTSSKLWFMCLLGILERYDVPDDPRHLGVKKGHFCAELLSVRRLVLQKRMGWGLPAYVTQVDFARAYDSVCHRAVLDAMLRRGVPKAVGLA